MEINFPFVYNGQIYSELDFFNLFQCAQCDSSLVSMDGGVLCSADFEHTGIKLFKEGAKMEESKPFEIKEVTTLTGIPIMEALTRLNAQLEQGAYRPLKIGGGVELTDINPGYLVEEMNKIFGPHGWGWRCEFGKDDFTIETGKFKTGTDFFNVSLIGLKMYYIISVDGAHREIGPIVSTGGATNPKLEYALKGAVTNAIGGAAHRLGWQVDVYKGLRTHSKEAIPEDYGDGELVPTIMSFIEAASLHINLDKEKEVAASQAEFAPAAHYNLVRSLDENLSADKLAEAIGEDASKAAKHTLYTLLKLAECEWAITQNMFDKPAKEITLGEFCSLWTALARIIGGDKKETVVKQYRAMTGKKDA